MISFSKKPGTITTAFGFLILNVMGMCAKDQVQRIHASWIITGMEDNHTFWDWPILVLPHYPVRGEQFPVNPNLPIAGWVFRAYPIPAS